MDKDSRVRELFSLTCELDPADRKKTLEEHCAEDPDLRTEVASLLEAHDRSEVLLGSLDDPFGAGQASLEGQSVSRYTIGRKLGAGGMGVVYEATDETLHRRVALKFLPPGFGQDVLARKRFETEAQTAAAADHPNICTVYEIGETDAGRLFIAMAFCDGHTLKEMLGKGPLSVLETVDIGIQIAEALARVHQKGILHRDIKPSNIMVQDDGLVKIVDFGIAKLRGHDVTSTSDTVGTLGYMAPERFVGDGASHQSDIWSVGVVLYEALTGQRPFDAPYAQAVTYKVLNEEPEPLSDVAPHIESRIADVVHRCLRKDPSDRFESANELLIALHRARTESSVAVEEPTSDGSPSKEPITESPTSKMESDPRKVFLCYKLGVELDEALAGKLRESLSGSCELLGDHRMGIGRRWVQRLENELAQSDVVLALLSSESARSELVLGQIELARRLKESNGRPALLPIRVNNHTLGYPLEAYIRDVPWITWDSGDSYDYLLGKVEAGIRSGVFELTREQDEPHENGDTGSIPRPHPAAQPARLEMPEGTMDPHSGFYIERPEDEIALEAVTAPGVTITIKGPRQMGKSSLLLRTMAAAADVGKSVIFLDFQLFDHHALAGGSTFFRRFCSWISDELDLEDRVDEFWNRPLGDSHLCTRYMAKHVLKSVDAPILLAMDEVERVFDTDFRSDFFSMLRSWHNDRAMKPLWRNLDLALVTSTEPYQLIENLNQSPFNVGEVLELTDFSVDQLSELNRRHRSPLNAEEVNRLYELVGGHPYLSRKALFQVASGRLSPTDLLETAADERGPFGDHLRNHLFRLHENQDLVRGMQEVLRSSMCTDESVFWRLRGAGLVRRVSGTVVARCNIYKNFFEEHLHA